MIRMIVSAAATAVVAAVLVAWWMLPSTAAAEEPPEAIFPQATVVGMIEVYVDPAGGVNPCYIIGQVDDYVPEVIIVAEPKP